MDGETLYPSGRLSILICTGWIVSSVVRSSHVEAETFTSIGSHDAVGRSNIL